jgi:hypothetical protein
MQNLSFASSPSRGPSRSWVVATSLSKDYDRLPQTAETMIYSVRIIYRADVRYSPFTKLSLRKSAAHTSYVESNIKRIIRIAAERLQLPLRVLVHIGESTGEPLRERSLVYRIL